MELETLGTVTLERLCHIVDVIRRHNHGKEDKDVDVTMEFLVGSLFPELFHNFQAKMNEEYHRGFKDGYNCGLESDWDDFVTALKNLGIFIQDEEGNYKNTYEILSEMSDKWKEAEEKNETN